MGLASDLGFLGLVVILAVWFPRFCVAATVALSPLDSRFARGLTVLYVLLSLFLFSLQIWRGGA